jgi:FkbM family methyltransferase
MNFIDVGASVGEFVMSVCRYQNVQQVFAFEPRPDCAYVLKKNAELNYEKRMIVFENAVGNSESNVVFNLNTGGTSSGLYRNSSINAKTINVKGITLDSALPEKLENPVMLVDVEGAEPKVFAGGINFIKNNKPLIIFEYNQTSKKYYNLKEIQDLLGQNYSIYRLRGDGRLDLEFSDSWNCVAIPDGSLFRTILESSIMQNN